MALNKEVFRTRAISAIVFVIVMMAGLLLNHWSFLLLFSAIHFGCWWEYLNLIGKINSIEFNRYLKFGWMLAGYAFMLSFCGKIYSINGYGLKENLFLPLSVSGFILLILGIFKNSNINFKSFAIAAVGWIYISLSWGMMIGLRQTEIGLKTTGHIAILPITLIVSIWINDTMAYIVGSFIGKTPFSTISPKKTWEGTAGGAILCVLTITLIGHFFFHLTLISTIVISLIAAITGTVGDLLESKIKRMANVKDTGTMMPGHGGFMDRFDSLLLAAPFVWLYTKILYI